MIINFILPGYSLRPGGGLKIMYEYANRLSLMGNDVMIYHAMNIDKIKYKYPALLLYMKAKSTYLSLPDWFDFNHCIKAKFIYKISNSNIRNADIIVSTQWTVALDVFLLSDSKGKKVNFIQGYETWIGNDVNGLYESYKLPITHIVVSDYLSDIVFKVSGVKPSIIYNSVDDKGLNIKNSIEDRNPYTISLLYSEQEFKGTKYAYEALVECHKKYPTLKVKMFGVYKKCIYTSEWITYERCPNNLCSLYNSTAIFLTTSLKEGWGLPATEAMACGCALVCTNVEGHTVFAHDKDTALLVDPKNVSQTVNSIMLLLDDNNYRINLAKRGNEYIKRFNWDMACEKMNKIFKELL